MSRTRYTSRTCRLSQPHAPGPPSGLTVHNSILSIAIALQNGETPLILESVELSGAENYLVIVLAAWVISSYLKAQMVLDSLWGSLGLAVCDYESLVDWCPPVEEGMVGSSAIVEVRPMATTVVLMLRCPQKSQSSVMGQADWVESLHKPTSILRESKFIKTRQEWSREMNRSNSSSMVSLHRVVLNALLITNSSSWRRLS